MRQRLSLAGALLGDPGVLIFDEPLNGLDPDGIRWIRGLLRELAAQGRTVFVSSHLLSEVAQTVDEVVVLSRGRLVAQTTLAELVARTSVVRVRTPDPSRLLQVLTAAGLQVRLAGASTVEATSATADAVGVAAAAAGVTILELSRHDENLESLFFDLVHQNQAAGSEFRHRTIVPVLLAIPHRARVFAVKVAVIAVLGAVFAALVFGLGLGTVVLTLSVHGIHHLPAGVGQLYLGTVISSACFGMIGVALGALTRNTIGAIVAAIAWTLFVEQVILAAIVPGIEKWLPTGAAIGLTNAPGPDPGHSLSPAAAGLALAGYAIVLLPAASRTTIRRDVG